MELPRDTTDLAGLRSIISSMWLARPSKGTSELPKKEQRRRRKVAYELVNNLASTFVLMRIKLNHRYVVRAIFVNFVQAMEAPNRWFPYLKRSLFEAREAAMTSSAFKNRVLNPTRVTKPEKLFQLSRLSRALPLPSQAACEVSLKKFYTTVTNEAPEADRNDFARIQFELKRYFTHKKIRRYVKPMHPSVSGTSACLEATGDEGGKLGALISEHGGPALSVQSRFMRDKVRSLEPSHFKLARSDAMISRLLSSPPESHDSRAVVVKERGLKTRIVTCNPLYTVTRSHQYRARLLRCVRDLPGCENNWEQQRTTIKVAPWSSKRFVFSADFSAATDTLSFAWLEFFCHSLNLPLDLVYRNQSVDGKQTRRGCFMGLPLSWSILSITHWLICKIVDPHGSFEIRGDDMICYWTVKMFGRYRRLVTAVGLELNDKKTFKSDRHGTFCEEMYRHDQTNHLVLVPTASVRWLTSKDSWSGNHYIRDAAVVAYYYVDRGCDPILINSVVQGAFGPLLRAAKKYGVHPYLPVSFGGMGFPHPHPEKKLKPEINKRIDRVITDPTVGLKIPPMVISGKGKLSEIMSQLVIEYSNNGVKCPHLKPSLAKWRQVGTFHDAIDGKMEPRMVPFSRWMKAQAKVLKAVPPTGRHPNAFGYTYRSLYRIKLYPMERSLERLGHVCDGASFVAHHASPSSV